MIRGVLYVLLFCFASCFTAQVKEDENSLLEKIKTEKNDSVKADLYLRIFDLYKKTDPERAYKFATRAFEVARQKNIPSMMASALNEIGYVFYMRNDYSTAKMKWLQAINITKIYHLNDVLTFYTNIASAEMALGRNKEAVNLLFSAMKETEKKENKKHLVTIYSNIGKIFGDMAEYTQSNYYYNKALLLLESNPKFTAELPIIFNNLGYNALKQGANDSAENYFNAALKQLDKKDDPVLRANLYNNLAEVYYNQKNPAKELTYAQKSLSIRQKMNYKDGSIYSLTYLGGFYKRNKEFKKAEEYYLQGYELAKEIKSLSHIKRLSGKLSTMYKENGKPEKELLYYKEFIAAKDSMKSLDLIREMDKKHLSFQYEKKLFADSMSHANERKIKDLEIENQRTELQAEKKVKYSIIVGLSLVALLSIYLYNRFKLIQKQNNLIQSQKQELISKNDELNKQKELIEDKQKEILDSIHYAKRIQTALLPTDKLIERAINKKGENS